MQAYGLNSERVLEHAISGAGDCTFAFEEAHTGRLGILGARSLNQVGALPISEPCRTASSAGVAGRSRPS